MELAADNASERTRFEQLLLAEQRARAVAERASERLTRLGHITSALGAALTPNAVLDAILQHGLAAAGAVAGAVALLDEQVQQLQIVRVIGYPKRVADAFATVPLSAQLPMAEAARTGAIVTIGSRERGADRFPELERARFGTAHQAWAAVPLLRAGRALGAVGLSFLQPQPFEHEDVAFIRTLGEQCAQALERAQLYESERQARAEAVSAAERATFLAEATGALAALLDYNTMIDRLARLAVPRLADLCTIHMLADDGAIHMLSVAHSDPAIETVLWERERRHPVDPGSASGLALVVHSGAPELVSAVRDAGLLGFALDDGSADERLQISSSLRLPLAARGRTLGAISFLMADSGRRYREGDTHLAEELARRAALALDNARLYRDAQAALRTRDEFLSVAAHELRTPLTALSGSTQLFARRARREGSLNERDARSLQLILSQSERLNRLIASLLDLSRIQLSLFSLDLAAVDLNDLVRRVAEEYQPLLEQHALVVEGEERPLLLRGDDLRLDQVFQNLIQNAVKYSPDGGDVTVHIGSDDRLARVSVRDTGVGIPESALPHLFQRYYRVPNATQQSGMGIGLYIVHEVVSLHGGAVRVESREGAGSTFTVELPLA